MQITLDIDETLAEALKERARVAGRPLEDVVLDLLRDGLRPRRGLDAARHGRSSATVDWSYRHVDLDKALQIVDALEEGRASRREGGRE